MKTVAMTLIAAAFGLLGAGAAQASVIYDWQPVTGTENFSTTGGRLVLSDRAFAASSATFSEAVDFLAAPTGTRFPDSDIVSVRLDIDNPGSSLTDDRFRIQANPTRAANANSLFYSLDADVDVAGDALTGRIALTTDQDDFRMSSNSEGLWTVDRFASDAGSQACFTEPQCGGATGRWQRTQTSHNVPAPAVWPLFGVAILALFGRRRFSSS